jgi:hypothetical protein
VDDPRGRSVPSLADVVLYLLGIVGLAAGITLLFLGMRAVMDVGGFCAEGGPYVIETQCPEGAAGATLLGIFGGLAGLFLAIWKGAAIGERAVGVLFLAWPALFGVIGLNFLVYGFDPPGEGAGWAWGWLICGGVFWVMAFGPLLLAWSGARAARGGSPGGVAATGPSGARLATTIREARLARDARRSALPPLAPLAPLEAAGTAIAPVNSDGEVGIPDVALVDGLERLAALHRAGSLTDEEYRRAKAELLERAGA